MAEPHLETSASSQNVDDDRVIYNELSEAVIALRVAMVDLVNKQSSLMEKLDVFVTKVMAHEERLKRLEDSLLTHLESATWVKATIRFWPLLVAALLLGQELSWLLGRWH
jgi:hypothetical protein